jgi:hypothetical protein
MEQILDGPAEFADLGVISDDTPLDLQALVKR